jgi:uncharacterized protein YigA (DUF484 family)
MALINEFRNDVEHAIQRYIQRFSSHDKIPKDRINDIKKIREILFENNLLVLHKQLQCYLDDMASGLMRLLPFFEVNKLRGVVNEILASPKYQDRAILKELSSEKKLHETMSNQENKIPASNENNDSISSRLQALEKHAQFQSRKTLEFEIEIASLKLENKYLSDTVKSLTKINQGLEMENGALKVRIQQMEPAYECLQTSYETLLLENQALKQQLDECLLLENYLGESGQSEQEEATNTATSTIQFFHKNHRLLSGQR